MLLGINVFRRTHCECRCGHQWLLEEAWEIWSRIHPLGTVQQSLDGTYTIALLVPVLQSLFVPSIGRSDDELYQGTNSPCFKALITGPAAACNRGNESEGEVSEKPQREPWTNSSIDYQIFSLKLYNAWYMPCMIHTELLTTVSTSQFFS